MIYGVNANMNIQSPTMYDMVGNWGGLDLGQSNLWKFEGIGKLAGAYANVNVLPGSTPYVSIGQTVQAMGPLTYTHAATGEVGLFDFTYNYYDNAHAPVYEYEKQRAFNYTFQVDAAVATPNAAAAVSAGYKSPIVLDLDGSGFDVSDQDGMLVYDANRDGSITDSEMMNETGINGEAGKYRNGWEKALSLGDLNRDGRLTDSELDPFSVWIDSSLDGVTDAGELRTMGDLNISEFDAWEGSFTRRREIGSYDLSNGVVYTSLPGTNNSSVFPGETAPVTYTAGPYSSEPLRRMFPTTDGTATPASPPETAGAWNPFSINNGPTMTSGTPGGQSLGLFGNVTYAATTTGPPADTGTTQPPGPGPELPPGQPPPGPGPELPPGQPPPGTPPSQPPTIPTPGPYPGDPGAPIPYPYPGDPGAPIPYPYPNDPGVAIPYPYPNDPGVAIPYPYPGVPNVAIPGPYPYSPGVAIPWPYPAGPYASIPYPYPGSPYASIPSPYPYTV